MADVVCCCKLPIVMSQKITNDAGGVEALEKRKQRRTIRVEKQQHPDGHGYVQDVKHVKSADTAKVRSSLNTGPDRPGHVKIALDITAAVP